MKDKEKHEGLMDKLIGKKQTFDRMFRALKSSEIDCRVSTVKEGGFSILLYKDARCDMNILDETVGAMNWKREHTRENANCIVSLWSTAFSMWIPKEDTGSESYTEKEKGLASDSFKRACFNWGIGRELYTAPFIWIKSYDKEVFKKGDKFSTYAKFEVSHISYDENYVINGLSIIDTKGNNRFSYGKAKASTNNAPRDFLKLFNNANTLEELQVLWDSLSVSEHFECEKIKETRKKIILSFKK